MVAIVPWEIHEPAGSSPSEDPKDVGCRGGHEEVARVATVGIVVQPTVATREPPQRLWMLGRGKELKALHTVLVGEWSGVAFARDGAVSARAVLSSRV